MSSHEQISIEITIQIISLFVGIIIASLAIFQFRQLWIQHNQSISLQTFETITGFIDDVQILEDRRIIYKAKSQWSSLIKEFNTCTKNITLQSLIKDKYNFKNKEFNPLEILEDVNNAAWETAVMYDRVCFLLSQNETLKNKIINFHGATILKVFIIIQGLMKRWEEERGRSDHPFFVKIAEEIWFKHKDERIKAISNLIISQDHVHIRKQENLEEIEVESIAIEEFMTWGKKIFNLSYQSDESELKIMESKRIKEKNTTNR